MPDELTELSLKSLDIVGVLDPARSRESEYKLRANHAIVVTAMDWQYNIFVLHTWAKRTDLNELLLQAEEVCKLFPTMRCFGVESVAAQIVIKDVIAEWLQLNRITTPVVELKPDTRVNKKWRIRMQIQRPATQGRLFLQEHHHELRTELFGFPHSTTIDLVDALGYCVALHYPPEEQTDYFEYAKSTQTVMDRMRQDGRIPEIPKRKDLLFTPPTYDTDNLRPQLTPSLRDIFPDRGDQY